MGNALNWGLHSIIKISTHKPPPRRKISPSKNFSAPKFFFGGTNCVKILILPYIPQSNAFPMAGIGRKQQELAVMEDQMIRKKIFSSVTEKKFARLQALASYHNVNESEIIRNAMESILCNKRLEDLLVNKFYEVIEDKKVLIIEEDKKEEEEVQVPETFNDTRVLTCLECGETYDLAGVPFIKINNIEGKWSCRNCFAAGDL